MLVVAPLTLSTGLGSIFPIIISSNLYSSLLQMGTSAPVLEVEH